MFIYAPIWCAAKKKRVDKINERWDALLVLQIIVFLRNYRRHQLKIKQNLLETLKSWPPHQMPTSVSYESACSSPRSLIQTTPECEFINWRKTWMWICELKDGFKLGLLIADVSNSRQGTKLHLCVTTLLSKIVFRILDTTWAHDLNIFVSVRVVVSLYYATILFLDIAIKICWFS